MKQKVVILIFTHRSEPSEFERLSFGQCFKILGNHPTRLVCPKGLDISAYKAIAPNLIADFIDPKWFCSLRDYNLLKVLPWLYRRYSKYEFMLTYELDAYVFRDELRYWCDQGWDYIGAPWFEDFYKCAYDSKVFGVGNSGFSLRRIPSCLNILNQIQKEKIKSLIKSLIRRRVSIRTFVAKMLSPAKLFAPFEGRGWINSDDLFWCLVAQPIFKSFKIPPYEVARRFAFEANARRLYDECERELPFGCHKWELLQPDFWREFMPIYHIEP